ncbi:MAG: hypothetical protein M3Y87_26990 [Myxococcota bacterium]|nr:hypothetical protein [Myxococcota bacterium]
MSELVITSRFRGPPDSGNGGYVCGCVARAIDGPARVRLHRPPPLERALQLERADGGARLLEGDGLVATGAPASLDVALPAIPDLERAREASRGYIGLDEQSHPFAGCFVCGPARAPGDGLRIFAGPIGDGIVAAPFEPSPDLLDEEGRLRPEIVWSALDCPGYFAIVGARMVPMLLGELAAEIRAPIGAGPHVVVGWSLGIEGRKARCGTALATSEGRVLAIALATWIRLA